MTFKNIIAATVVAASFSAPAMAQVTSVTQLRDVQPTEWSYQAISNLIPVMVVLLVFPMELSNLESLLPVLNLRH